MKSYSNSMRGALGIADAPETTSVDSPVTNGVLEGFAVLPKYEHRQDANLIKACKEFNSAQDEQERNSKAYPLMGKVREVAVFTDEGGNLRSAGSQHFADFQNGQAITVNAEQRTVETINSGKAFFVVTSVVAKQ